MQTRGAIFPYGGKKAEPYMLTPLYTKFSQLWLFLAQFLTRLHALLSLDGFDDIIFFK